MKSPIFVFAAVTALATTVNAQSNHQPYKGFEAQAISSLSLKDIEDLKSGAGWGLALPAELNGYPGPAHVLEFQTELDLTTEQTDATQAIFDSMKAEAVTSGLALIDAERDLDLGFKAGDLTPPKLRELIGKVESARANLRYIHLSRHLQSIDLLSPEQILKYSNLRGYTSDPCISMPDGHDATMWRRHNGCDG